MATTTRNLRRYDHLLRELVQSSGDIQHAIHRGVPRSTAHGWLKSPRTEVVTVDVPADPDSRWRRPRKRIHPAKPKVGIRASRPNEIWHVDTTLIRLLDGNRAYLHAGRDVLRDWKRDSPSA